MRTSWILGAAAAVILSASARADLLFSVVSTSAAAGSSGNSLYVTVQNTGGSTQNLADFSVGISSGSSKVTFTGGDTTTSPTYIFNGDSFDVINSSAFLSGTPGQIVEASDGSNSGNGTNMASGATFGAAHLFFSVDPSASNGPINISLATACATPGFCTSANDDAFALINFTVAGGTITVTGNTGTPEPSTLILSLLGLPALALLRRKVR